MHQWHQAWCTSRHLEGRGQESVAKLRRGELSSLDDFKRYESPPHAWFQAKLGPHMAPAPQYCHIAVYTCFFAPTCCRCKHDRLFDGCGVAQQPLKTSSLKQLQHTAQHSTTWSSQHSIVQHKTAQHDIFILV